MVTIDRSGGQKLGVDIDDSDGVSLVIMTMGKGLIAEWNMINPETDMRIGDRIVEVNGLRGDVGRMFAECLKPQVLHLGLVRDEALELLACPTESSEVLVHVYDLWGSRLRLPRLLNSGSTRFGVFHTGIEVYGREWYFCGTDTHLHGVYCMPEPKVHPIHRYSKTVSMGHTQLSREDLAELIPLIRDKWPGRSYHPFRRNCHHFTNFFCQVLGFPSGPSFGICGAGDRRLAQSTSPSHNACSRCFPCTHGGKLRHSAPLLPSETERDRDGGQMELPVAAASRGMGES